MKVFIVHCQNTSGGWVHSVHKEQATAEAATEQKLIDMGCKNIQRYNMPLMFAGIDSLGHFSASVYGVPVKD